RFIQEQLEREGVDTLGVITDPERLTPLVILGIRDEDQFPLIFYRENCADMALSEDNIDPAFIAEARCLTATGTHLSHTRTEAAVLKAVRLARENGARTALDIDYRPNLWGLSGHDDGDNRFIASGEVTKMLQSTLSLFDLIVGTEEEIFIAGGSTDLLTALQSIRAITNATLIVKRGAMGAVAFEGPIPDDLEQGTTGEGFPIEVFNVLGAGDGFMAGLLKGWMDDEDWPTSLRYANACGALAVSRHGCAPAYPSWDELQFFLERGVVTPALQKDADLEHVHWATNRRGDWPTLRAFAFDHRAQFEKIADEAGVSHPHIGYFKSLCLDAALDVAGGKPGHGILCDERLGQKALHRAAGSGLWIGRPAECPGSRPLRLEIGSDFGSALVEWPLEHVVKVLCHYHPDDDAGMKADQEETLQRLALASRAQGLELLVEVIPSKAGPVNDKTTTRVMQRLYEIGIRPDWWKLEPMGSDTAWSGVSSVIEAHDPWCRGVVVLGLAAAEAELTRSFAAAARHPIVKGFAVGRTIFADAAKAWFSGSIDDGEAVAMMSERYSRLCSIWDQARADAAIAQSGQ
ncbi:MAG: bifunctional 5-dehydro-2-deoxygluconokinase/5-dehydro-2-deoxyphosphogluconate aldolase, partial [Geminicoccaceae bacterium]